MDSLLGISDSFYEDIKRKRQKWQKWQERLNPLSVLSSEVPIDVLRKM